MIVMRNPRGTTTLVEPPLKSDGTPHRYEMIFGGLKRRAYADSATELCEALIPGYQELADPAEQGAARFKFAVAQQVTLQALIVAESNLAGCRQEREVLLGPRHVPPELEVWEAHVPLVLVDSYYEPDGPRRRPVGASSCAREGPLEPHLALRRRRGVAAAVAVRRPCHRARRGDLKRPLGAR